MTWLIVILALSIGVVGILEWKTFAWPRYIARSERLRMRFIQLEHEAFLEKMNLTKPEAPCK